MEQEGSGNLRSFLFFVKVMDGRMILNGRQVNHLTEEDLPITARAIMSVVRGRASAKVEFIRSVSLVHLVGTGFDLFIRGSDWVKILPYLANDYLSPSVVAVAKTTSSSYTWETADIDIMDKDLYRRVYELLQMLFTKKYPT